MKRKISIILILTILATMVLPMGGFAYTLEEVSMKKVANEYFYDDFSAYDGTNITVNAWKEGIGYYVCRYD